MRRQCLLLLAAASLAPASAWAAEALCPDQRATTGVYRNDSYGFTVVIPKGLEGWWNSSLCVPEPAVGCVCMGDHGRELPLRGGGSMSIEAAPQVFEASLATAAYKDLQAFEARTETSELAVNTFTPWRLGALTSYRYLATSAQAAVPVVREAVHVALPSGGYVVISIEAPEPQYHRYRRSYVALRDSLRPSPRR